MDVAEELLDVEGTVDQAYVERRLRDWRHRLDRLYADVQSWLPDGWSMVDGGTACFQEELMRKFELPPESLPVKILMRSGQSVGRLEPRGLWIIGANGRVDLICPPRHFIIVDRAQNLDQPRWTIMPLRDRLNDNPLIKDTFVASLV